MKKILSVILATMLIVPAFAKEEEKTEQKASRDYSTWLPAAGDWSLGFSLDPIASFIGNMFNGNTDNYLRDLAGESMVNNMFSIMGGYMITDQLGVRANIGLNISRMHDHAYVVDDLAKMADPLSRSKVEDIVNSASTSGSIALGADYRVGKRSVQGVFGGGLVYAFSAFNTTYKYGNAITEANQRPTIDGSYDVYDSYMPYARPLKNFNYSGMHTFGAYASVGVEWFVAPKISLGANVNLYLLYQWTPNRYVTYEGWNNLTLQKETVTDLKYPVSSGFHFGTDNIGANLLMSFYF